MDGQSLALKALRLHNKLKCLLRINKCGNVYKLYAVAFSISLTDFVIKKIAASKKYEKSYR